jgi:predicted transposase YbfD/YdcC
VKTNQPTLHRQISRQFEGKRQIPFAATAHEKRHGRDTHWELRTKEAPDHIKQSWPGSAWIVELITTTIKRKGKRSVRRHLFITSIRTTPEALLRLIRQRWSIENEWHWARDTQLGEDAHRYANRIGAPLFSFLRTVVMNLLRRGGLPLNSTGSARAGPRHQRDARVGRCSGRRERHLNQLSGSPERTDKADHDDMSEDKIRTSSASRRHRKTDWR